MWSRCLLQCSVNNVSRCIVNIGLLVSVNHRWSSSSFREISEGYFHSLRLILNSKFHSKNQSLKGLSFLLLTNWRAIAWIRTDVFVVVVVVCLFGFFGTLIFVLLFCRSETFYQQCKARDVENSKLIGHYVTIVTTAFSFKFRQQRPNDPFSFEMYLSPLRRPSRLWVSPYANPDFRGLQWYVGRRWSVQMFLFSC